MSSFLYYVSDFIVVPITGSVNKGFHNISILTDPLNAYMSHKQRLFCNVKAVILTAKNFYDFFWNRHFPET